MRLLVHAQLVYIMCFSSQKCKWIGRNGGERADETTVSDTNVCSNYGSHSEWKLLGTIVIRASTVGLGNLIPLVAIDVDFASIRAGSYNPTPAKYGPASLLSLADLTIGVL